MPDAETIAQLREAVSSRFGLYYPDGNLRILAEVLQRRAARFACTPAAYVSMLAYEAGSEDEWQALADLVTVGETYFFRNSEQFTACCAVALPALLSSARSRGMLSILSAGCSSGEEPYTLAICFEEQPGLFSGTRWSLTACDVNPLAIARARQGSYPAWSLRETPVDRRERWFGASGRDFQLADAIRNRVDFSVRNLLDGDEVYWRPGRFEVIFCRNVLMYLVPDIARMVVQRLAQALVPGGYLFLGHAETLRGLSTAFTLCHSHGAFYYRRLAADAPQEAAPHGSALVAPARNVAPAPGADPIAWIGAIGRSAQRIATLASCASERRIVTPSTALPPRSQVGMGTLIQEIAELIRHERVGEAGERLGAISAQTASEPMVRVLRAVVQLHAGEYRQAEALCRSVLGRDASNARACYLLALCREEDGDIEAANAFYCTAAAHDRAFALPHLRLALLARRRGDEEQAGRSFAKALALIDGEDELNLALFGGGFNRQIIAELCRGQPPGGPG